MSGDISRIRKQLQREIKAGRELEYHFPLFFNKCACVYYAYTGIQFIMEFYDFYEGYKDGDKLIFEEMKEILREISSVLEESFFVSLDGAKREENVKQLFAVRNRVMRKMQQLTVYAERFWLYEYVLERIAPGFLPKIEAVEDDKAVSEVLAYIFSGKDNAVISRKVRDVISHLPVRMTKERFYELIRDNLLRYQDSDVQTAENFIYMLRSAAGLLTPREEAPAMKVLLARFCSINYREVKKDEFNELRKELTQVTEQLFNETDAYYAIQRLLNLLLAFLLNAPYAKGEERELLSQLHPLLKEVHDGMEQLLKFKKGKEISQEGLSLFRLVEGRLEIYSEELIHMQAMLEEIKLQEKDKEDFISEPLYECMKLSEKLTSTSLFIELDEVGSNKKAEREYLEKKAAELSAELAERFLNQPKMVNRAMIAAVLKELPLFLNSRTEISDYIKSALSGCHDMAERAACMRLIRQDIQQE